MLLTKVQSNILSFIIQQCKDHNYSPSYREIAEEFGYSSLGTVVQHVRALKDKGYLCENSRSPRTLIPASKAVKLKKAMELPLLGMIAAGEPIEAVENRETVAVPAEFVRDENSYVLKVRGESMIEDGILDGDYVVVERNYYPKNGDVVVALLDNAFATLKRYYREKDRIRLQPANKTMEPIYVENPAIQGVVRAVIRRFQTA